MNTAVDALLIVLIIAAAIAAGGLFWLGHRQSRRQPGAGPDSGGRPGNPQGQ
ncbi:hypothetical protein [Propionibacterium australiense]|uniref:Uncharacterized protein n=1 Tax=Propionibacterium australiense TaxID=119981 RepID=A0A383SA12_9ACTN|nr:hypothetical protein [Propionibacterium australiense]SYZ34382.1 Hypothetical protein PROPAUS_2393 [Propionibacterium australiense]VEH92067.1 Uncharacterised protein [Propionibacterium australiense]